MMNLYIPYTPYHILLCFAIALSKKDEQHYLILGKSNSANKQALRLLQKIYASVKVIGVELEDASEKSNLKTFFLKKRNLRIVETVLSELPSIDCFFYFLGWHVTTVYSAFLARKRNHDVEFLFVEDGVESYANVERRPKNLFEKFADRVFYGEWYSGYTGAEDFMESKTAWALFPDLLPVSFDKKNKFIIPKRELLSGFDREVFNRECRGLPNSVYSLVVVDFDNYTESVEYLEILSFYIKKASSLGGSTALKLHPSDNRKMAVLSDSVLMLPSNIPAELFFLYYGEKLQYVIGGLTTALLTAKWLLPEAKVVSSFPKSILSKAHYSDITLKLFSSCGIEVHIL